MKYAVKMGSGAMIRIPDFIKTGSGIQKLIGGGFTDTDSTETAYAYFHFIKTREVG
jgi:hypothetical protein